MKFISKKLLLMLAILVIIIVAILVWLQTNSGQAYIKNKISSVILDNFGLESKIDGFSFKLPIKFKIKKLSLSNNIQQSLILDDITLSIRPSFLFFWQTTIESIDIDKLQIDKFSLPANKNKLHSSGISSQSYINFVPHLSFEKINISHIGLGEELISKFEIDGLSFKGSAFYNSKQSKLNYRLGLIAESLSSNGTEIFSFSSLVSAGNYEVASKGLDISDIKFNSEQLNINATANIDIAKKFIEADINYSSSLVKKILSGYLPIRQQSNDGNIKLKGGFDEFTFNCDGEFEFALEEDSLYNFPKMNYSSYGNYNIDNNQLYMESNLSQANFVARGQISVSANEASLQNFTATHQANNSYFKKDINLTYNITNSIFDGFIAINTNDLALITAYLPWLKGGQANFKANFAGKGNKQTSEIKGNIDNIYTSWGNADSISININSTDLYNLLFAESTILANKIYSGDRQIEKAKATFKSKRKNKIAANFSINDDQNSLKTEGLLDFGNIISYNFKDFIFKNEKYNLALNSGASNFIKYNAKQKKLDLAFAANTDIGKIIINLQNKLGKIKGEILLDKIYTDIFDSLLPINLGNSLISCGLNIAGPADDISISGILELANLKISNKIYSLRSIFEDSSDNKSGITSSLVDANNKEYLNVSSKIPLTCDLQNFAFGIKPDAPWRHEIKIYQNASLINILNLPGHTISGDIFGTLNITGSFNKPQFYGDLKLERGQYSYGRYGINLYDISGTISATDQIINFSQIACFDSFKNKAIGNGKINLGDNLNYNLQINGNNFNLINMPYLYSHIGGDFQVKGDKYKAKASGNITFDKTNIKIPENINNSIPKINITKSTIDTNNEAIIKDKYMLELDIRAATKKQILVKGYGIDAELKGSLDIKGDIYKPLVYGKLKTSKGYFNKYGRTLQINEGNLTFNGEVPPSPYISVMAVQKTPAYEVRLTFEGPINNPQLNIQTTPETSSQKEAISLLLFGKPISEISISESLQILTIVGSETTIGSKLPIKDFSLRSGKRVDSETGIETEETRFGYSHYLNQNIYVDIENPSNQFAPKGRLNLRITPIVTVEATMDDESNNSFGISFQYDY